tara:strand:- start:312 stop:515 length:204 start_codon:yes stop_codon:yes gene_type:complete
MRDILLTALRAEYKGGIAKARANIDVYLTNPAGIGEHSDIVEAIDEQVAKLAEYTEKLDTLDKYFPL